MSNKELIQIKKDLHNQEWYQALLDELQNTFAETVAVAKETVLEGKWLIGKTIEDALQEYDRAQIYGAKINSMLSKDLGWSEREIARCRQFYNKFPGTDWKDVFMKLPEGRNLSWHKMAIYLTGETPDKENKHYISVLVNDEEQIIYLKDKYRDYQIEYLDK